MKKIITLVLAATLAFTALTTAAFAQRRRADINTELQKSDEIHILYNDKMVQYEDVKPVINEDRVMIPFRAALESMGAKVGYNEAQRLVTAQKGNIIIRFTLLDSVIHINNNGAESDMVMDVPMIIREDRTLVPIRFMSNALGMQVGWDGVTRTVVVMDYDAVADEISRIAPNLAKYAALPKRQMNERIFTAKMTSDSGSHDLSATAYKSGDTLYVKTDTINMADVAFGEALESGSEWCSIDMKRIFRALNFDDRQSAVLMSAMSGENTDSITDAILNSMTREGDAVFSEATDLALLLDLVEQMDKYVTVTQTENGYNVTINISKEQLAGAIGDAMGVKTDEATRAALAETIGISVTAAITYDGERQTSEATLTMPGKTITYTETATESEFSKPENPYDITEVFVNML